jgi:polyhydroxybutyrate depolymerase
MPRPSALAARTLAPLTLVLAACGGASPAVSEGDRTDPRDYASPGTHDVTLSVRGAERTYSLLVPASYDGSAPVPLVLAFHGYTMSPTSIVYGAWAKLAEEHGFILAAPAGIDTEWAVATDDAEAQSALPNSDADLAEFPTGDRDVIFAAAVLADVTEYLLVDQDRILVTGESLGGFMASRVACEMGEAFAALGPTLNSLLYSAPCPTDHAVAVISVGHLLDTTHAVVDAETAAAGWASHNGCGTTIDETMPDDLVTGYAYTSCPASAPVSLVIHDRRWADDADEQVIWSFFTSLP